MKTGVCSRKMKRATWVKDMEKKNEKKNALRGSCKWERKWERNEDFQVEAEEMSCKLRRCFKLRVVKESEIKSTRLIVFTHISDVTMKGGDWVTNCQASFFLSKTLKRMQQIKCEIVASPGWRMLLFRDRNGGKNWFVLSKLLFFGFS